MPVLFVGHGSPMNAIEDNVFTQGWIRMAKEIPAPQFILCVSAHWFTRGSKICDAAQPQTVYDMYGFPPELYQVQYDAPGSPQLAGLTRSLIEYPVEIDNSWGIDHGTWSVLRKMYPLADIPVVQLSIDRLLPAAEHFRIGSQLRSLREQGVLIIGSGNVVHNLRSIDWHNHGGSDSTTAFDGYIKDKILRRDFASVIDYHSAGKAAFEVVPTPEHFYPLLYILGLTDETDTVSVYNEAGIYGSLSMTSYLFA